MRLPLAESAPAICEEAALDVAPFPIVENGAQSELQDDIKGAESA